MIQWKQLLDLWSTARHISDNEISIKTILAGNWDAWNMRHSVKFNEYHLAHGSNLERKILWTIGFHWNQGCLCWVLSFSQNLDVLGSFCFRPLSCENIESVSILWSQRSFPHKKLFSPFPHSPSAVSLEFLGSNGQWSCAIMRVVIHTVSHFSFMKLIYYHLAALQPYCFGFITRTLKINVLCGFFIQTFKWQDYLSWQRKLNEAKASAAALKAGVSGMRSEGNPPKSKWRAFFRKSPLEDMQVVKNNIYDKGFFQNLLEIVFPPSMRSSLLQTKSKSGWNFHSNPVFF